MKKQTILILACLCSVLFGSKSEATRLWDKALDPESIAVTDQKGIKYIPSFDYNPSLGKTFYIEARDSKTSNLLWKIKVYQIVYDLSIEQDTQDRYITALHIEGNKLIVFNEDKEEYEVDLESRGVTKRNHIAQKEMALNPESHFPQLTKQEVIELANREAVSRGYDLTEYDLGDVEYEYVQKDKTWTVFYNGKKLAPGNHFGVFVHDETGACKLMLGE